MNHRAQALPPLLLVLAISMGYLFGCDPIHTEAVDALGGETPGTRPGPQHRPGQPCLTCHDGTIGNPGEFSVAGTVYVDEEGKTPASGAVVTLTSADATTFSLRTNNAGNFFARPKDYAPVYPMRVAVSYGGISVDMVSLIGRDGSCGDCHGPTPGPSSEGRIFIPADGGTP